MTAVYNKYTKTGKIFFDKDNKFNEIAHNIWKNRTGAPDPIGIFKEMASSAGYDYLEFDLKNWNIKLCKENDNE